MNLIDLRCITPAARRQEKTTAERQAELKIDVRRPIRPLRMAQLAPYAARTRSRRRSSSLIGRLVAEKWDESHSFCPLTLWLTIFAAAS